MVICPALLCFFQCPAVQRQGRGKSQEGFYMQLPELGRDKHGKILEKILRTSQYVVKMHLHFMMHRMDKFAIAIIA